MFLLTKPNRRLIQQFLDARKNDDYSYADVGATRSSPPAGYNVDHNRILLGHGAEAYSRAKQAVREWKMFDFPWVSLCWHETPIEEGETVAVLVRHLGFYSLNAARVVYVVDETGALDRFGFAYGTLTEHGERGEERFSVEYHRAGGEVWYDLYAFSRPNHFLARLGYPFSRLLQKRFAAESKNAMLRAVVNRDSSQPTGKGRDKIE